MVIFKRWYHDRYDETKERMVKTPVCDHIYLDVLEAYRKKKLSRVFYRGRLYYLDWFWK